MTFDKKSELNILINLAASDNKVEEKEAKLIHTIAKANGISREEVEVMIKSPKPIHNLNGMTQEEKFEHLYYLIQLMKMDGQVFRSEIIFCEQMAEKLGFKKGVFQISFTKNDMQRSGLKAGFFIFSHDQTNT
ncbi:MAG: TerB family tellurite resistance protein [Cytophagia bacterium]|nr:TerB family tellurite resistance protein [Cytophagia bacterium]